MERLNRDILSHIASYLCDADGDMDRTNFINSSVYVKNNVAPCHLDMSIVPCGHVFCEEGRCKQKCTCLTHTEWTHDEIMEAVEGTKNIGLENFDTAYIDVFTPCVVFKTMRQAECAIDLFPQVYDAVRMSNASKTGSMLYLCSENPLPEDVCPACHTSFGCGNLGTK